MKKYNLTIHKERYKRIFAVCFVIIFVTTGTFLLINSHAATGDNTIEPENGTISTSATVINDSTASNAKAVKFTGTLSSSCPNSTPHMPDSSDGMGGCWPGPTTTGVPSGTNLTNYTGSNTISTANTIIDGKNITTCINVTAPGVIIRRSKISCSGGNVVNVTDGSFSGTGLLIEDTEIHCNDTNGNGIGEANFTARRVNIHGCENGLDMNQSIQLENSYIHDMFNSAQAHTDGMQFGFGHIVNGNIVAGGLNVTISHNTIYGMGVDGSFGTSAIISNRGFDTNILIENNLMAGGAYTLYCERNATGVNYRVINNRFSTRFGPNVGAFGPSTDCSDEIQSSNKIEETGQLITLQ